MIHEDMMLTERSSTHEAEAVEKLSVGVFVSNQIEPARQTESISQSIELADPAGCFSKVTFHLVGRACQDDEPAGLIEMALSARRPGRARQVWQVHDQL